MEQYRCYGCMQLISDPVCPHCGHPCDGVNFPHQLPVGTVLAGRYFVGRAINQTQTALVYISYDQNQEKPVLVCEYYPGAAASREGAQVQIADGTGLESFRREAALMVGSEEIARVSGTVDAFEENGTAYIVMDQIRGPGLQMYIGRRGGALEAQETLRILHGVVAAAAVLHQGGCAHGAIGLDKIVLDPMGGARLLGFGEIAGANPADDVYALSRMLCDAIAPGAEPNQIPGLTEQQQMVLHMGSRPDPRERFNSAVALRRALYGEVTPPVENIAPLAVFGAAPVQSEPAAGEQSVVVPVIVPEELPEVLPEVAAAEVEMPRTEAVTPEVEMPKTEAVTSEVLPEMPKTEAITSDVLTPAESEPVIPAAAPVVTPASSMPATEIVSEFKVKWPVEPQHEPVAPQPEPEIPQWQPEQPSFEMPRTEAAPVTPPPAWDVPPQPQWQPDQPWQPEQPWQTPPPKKKSGLIIGIVVGLVVALIAALVACYFFVHIWKDATCEEPRTCALCGKTEGKALGHEWLAATCEAPETCEKCGETEGSALGHNWAEATCVTAKTCLTCGAVEGSVGGHTWVDATCLDPKYCSTCGETEGKALGHSWKEATYTDPKTCTRCGETEGEPKGYMEYVSGEFERFKWGSSTTSAYVFDRPINNVKGFTLYFKPTFNYNSWVDDWKLLYQDTSGVWHEYGSFTLDTSDYEHEFNFSTKLNIKAVAVVPKINGTYSYSFSLGVWYLYYTN